MIGLSITLSKAQMNISHKYERSGIPVSISNLIKAELESKGKKVLALQRKGIKLIFPDVFKIEKKLLSKQKQ